MPCLLVVGVGRLILGAVMYGMVCTSFHVICRVVFIKNVDVVVVVD